MDRKKAPHKLQVEDSKQDDNSIVEMTQAKMDELKIFRGDAVILKGMYCTTNFKLANAKQATFHSLSLLSSLSNHLWGSPHTLMKYSA